MLALIWSFLAVFPVPLAQWKSESYPLSGCVSDDGLLYAVLPRDRVDILKQDGAELKLVAKLDHEDALCCAFLRGSHDLVVGDATGLTIYKREKEKWLPNRIKSEFLLAIVLLPSPSRTYVLCYTGLVHRIDRETEEIKQIADLGQPVRSACITDDGETIVVGLRDGQLVILAAKTGKEIKRLKAHTKSIGGLELIDKNTLVTASMDKTVKVWELADLRKPKVVIETTSPALSVCKHNGSLLVGLLDGSLCAYSFSTAKLQVTTKLHDSDCHTLVVTPKSGNVLAVGKDRVVTLLQIRTSK